MKLKNIAVILAAVIIAILCICICGCTENEAVMPPVQEDDTAAVNAHNAPTTVYDVHNAPAQLPEKIEYSPLTDLVTATVIEESKESRGEYVIIDNRDFTYTLKAIIPDGYHGFELLFELQNHSGRPITVRPSFIIVNGWQINCREQGSCTAEAHSTVEYSLLCGNAKDMSYGTEVDEIKFYISYSDYYEFAYTIGRYAIYPSGKSPEQIKYADIVVEDDDVIVLDNSNIKYVIKGIYNGERMLVVAENKTDSYINCITNYEQVNGLGGDANHSVYRIAPHACTSMTLFFNRGNHNILPAEFSFDLVVEKVIATCINRTETNTIARGYGYYTLTKENVDKLKWLE